ncbi:MAG: transcriptional repressor LexA [Candidatus Bathyarchaeia archaeon]
MALTRRQKEVIDFVANFIEKKGYSPTLEEIAKGLNLASVATVHKHIANLQEKGALKREWNRGRSLELLPLPPRVGAVELPLLGYVSAGEPIEAIEDNLVISVPQDLVGKGKTYVLRVRGNSMIDEQIRDGDFVIVEEREWAENGETVVALIHNSEATLKKYYRENGHIRLQPANPQVEPIILKEEEVRIQGVVIGILRKFR